MELFLQFGYGMMEHSRLMVREWGEGTVILSPRDLNANQISRLANDLHNLGGRTLLDPQFYLPHADHERLRSHDYWPQEYESTGFWSSSDLRELLRKLYSLNRELHCTDFILPGIYAAAVDDDWLARQEAVIEEAESLNFGSSNLLATVALSSEATRNEDQIHAILDAADSWNVDGVYLVCEHPNGEYLVTDPIWLANVLDLTAGFRLKGKRTIIGYCNHQMLITACSSATAISSGTWMNVRSFPPDKFRETYEDEVRQRKTWYYCPQAFSEFGIPFLDIAQRQGLLSEMAVPPDLANNYATVLFQGTQPTTGGFTEPLAFRHYLQCLRDQVVNSKKHTFDATAAAHEQQLDQAESLLSRLHAAGIRGQHRDFSEAIDANRAALNVLRSDRRPMLNRYWTDL